MNLRVGSAFDLHQLKSGIELKIGGISIPNDKGSLGHSDGDVLIHTICDAILGALNLGDLGKYFPSTDDSIQGMDSKDILKKIMEVMQKHGAEIVNIDSTVILERPRLSIYVPSMKKSLSEILGIEENRISIKSKSADGSGSIGSGDAVAAFCTLLITFNT